MKWTKTDSKPTDLDVHMALVLAPSYAKQVNDQYYMDDSVTKTLRDYVDMFGFVQKNMNALGTYPQYISSDDLAKVLILRL